MRILRDTRERKGYWTFGRANPCKKVALKTGDYTVEGYENVLAIERKKTIGEIVKNFSKYDSKRFWAEMERLKEFDHAYLLLEFTAEELSRYPFDLPYKVRRKIRIRGPYLHKLLGKIEDMGIRVIFCGDRAGAIEIARQIFSQFGELN